ncbi:hypothetical protein JOB18_010270 [Solea senegalensis]|uniref:Uncharacterized protein n=1 Tax=Solea senegalensis TaxID=28829 RepID=A0AAV6PSI3_SOLSE|nr:hypothetical protein JOB18_010270 [Solea senegalensis]
MCETEAALRSTGSGVALWSRMLGSWGSVRGCALFALQSHAAAKKYVTALSSPGLYMLRNELQAAALRVPEPLDEQDVLLQCLERSSGGRPGVTFPQMHIADSF